MDFVNISEQQVANWIEILHNKILFSKKNYECVVGIANGGLNISVPLARKLDIPHFSVKISFYSSAVQTDLGLVIPDVDENFQWRPNSLLVDDLIDSGKTVDVFKSRFGPADVAVLLWNKQNKPIPDFFAEEKPKKWVVFPWEI